RAAMKAPVLATRLAAIRILVGLFATGYVVARVVEFVHVARLPAKQFDPVGVARLASTPIPPLVELMIVVATIVLLAAFTAGYRFRLTAPLAALGFLWITSYRNSWGMVFHTENLVALHLIALACMPAADAWAVRAPPRADGSYVWGLRLVAAITAATYVLAGIAKLRLAGLDWMDGELLRNQVAVDNLRKALLGDTIAPLATQLLDHPNGFIGFALMTLVIELGAPILVLGIVTERKWIRRLVRFWIAGAVGFHLGVVLMMNIWFPYPLTVIPFMAALPVERSLAWIGNQLRSKLRL
ncbi:MAG: hypothetical protein NT062_28650, partial [Proteobacteria bacterium]|nr:hypothetical protein [Pseudomonadota bacterium]